MSGIVLQFGLATIPSCSTARSASTSSTTVPTTPVAPTTPIRASSMLALRLGRVELERAMELRHRPLDLLAADMARDLDRRGRHQLGLDPRRRHCLEGLRGDPRMALHPRPDHAHGAEIVTCAPLDAQTGERLAGRVSVLSGRGEEDLGFGA